MAVIKFGINAGPFQDAKSVVPGLSTSRSYRDNICNATASDLPTTWPLATGASYSTVSIRPDPTCFLNDTPVPDNGSGFTTLREQVHYLAQQAPADGTGKLTCFHEAGNLFPAGVTLTPSLVRQLHVACWQACQGTPCKYGVIVYGDLTAMDEWIPGYPYEQGKPGSQMWPMDWYGVDMYDNGHPINYQASDGTIDAFLVDAYMAQYKTLAQGRTGLSSPQIDVCECNSPNEANRGPFFSAIAGWLHANGGRRIEMFYKDGGPSGGAWDPNDQATIDTLNQLFLSFGTTPTE